MLLVNGNAAPYKVGAKTIKKGHSTFAQIKFCFFGLGKQQWTNKNFFQIKKPELAVLSSKTVILLLR